jgi:5-methylcytosine-specific restriction endonuclease McrA
MTNAELESKIRSLIKTERSITNQILRLINLAEDRRLPLERGFGSTFDWLTKGLGYSAGAAHRRIQTARLLRTVPDAEAKLESGALNLTNLAKAQSSIRAQQKATGVVMNASEQADIVRTIERKTTAEAELVLVKLLPETAVLINQERVKRIDHDFERVSLNFTAEDMRNLEWFRDYYSHAMPNATNGQILARLMFEVRQKKSISAAETKRAKTQRQSCQYTDEETGRVCGSTWQVEVDHVVPKALGGTDDPSNLRCLCRQHNKLMAERWLGRRWANSWRTRPSRSS